MKRHKRDDIRKNSQYGQKNGGHGEKRKGHWLGNLRERRRWGMRKRGATIERKKKNIKPT